MHLKIFILSGLSVLVFAGSVFPQSQAKIEKYPGGGIRLQTPVDGYGFPHGIQREFYEDGSPMFEKTYARGVLEGKSRMFYQGGGLMTEWMYKNGKRNGPTTGYFRNGKPKDKGVYEDDRLNGPVKFFYEDGNLKGEMEFKDDRPTGTAKTYHRNGKLEYRYSYQKGQLRHWKLYDETGKLVSEHDMHTPIIPP